MLHMHIAYKTHPSVSTTLNYVLSKGGMGILKVRKCGK